MSTASAGEIKGKPSPPAADKVLGMTLTQFLDALSSGQPTPGGGAAAGLAGALAAALVGMVCRVTRAGSQAQEQERLAHEADRLRQRLTQTITDDIAAYQQLAAAYALPRSTPDQAAARQGSIQRALPQAALVPLETTSLCCDVLGLCAKTARLSSHAAQSDVAVALFLAEAGVESAAWLVRANLDALEDHPPKREIDQKLEGCLKRREGLHQEAWAELRKVQTKG